MRDLLFFTDSQESDVIDTLHLLTIDVERWMCGRQGSRKVHNNRYGFYGVQN